MARGPLPRPWQPGRVMGRTQFFPSPPGYWHQAPGYFWPSSPIPAGLGGGQFGGGYPGFGLGGGLGGGPGTLVGSYQDAINRANAANEARYGQILGEYGGLRSRVNTALGEYGQGLREDILQRYRNNLAESGQRLVSAGLANTTARITAGSGVAQQANRDLLALEDALTRQRVGTDIDLTQGLTGVIERRQDIAPDYGQLLQLAQSLGQGGYPYSQYGGAGIPGVFMQPSPILPSLYPGIGQQQPIQRGSRGQLPRRGARSPLLPPDWLAAVNRAPWRDANRQRVINALREQLKARERV